MLASDLNNPEFQGAANPNSMVSVEFFDFAAPDPWASREKQMKVFKEPCPFIKISIPGRTDLTVERPATQSDSINHPHAWARFQLESGRMPSGANIPGWSIESWDELNPDQVKSLKYLSFNTVEQIAGANDTQIQGIGMGGPGLRLRAQTAIAARNGKAVSDAVKERDEEIKGLKDTVTQMQEMMKQFMAAQAIKPTEQPEVDDASRETLTVKRGPGRPAREATA